MFNNGKGNAKSYEKHANEQHGRGTEKEHVKSTAQQDASSMDLPANNNSERI